MKLIAELDANPMVEYRFLLLCDDRRANLSPLDDLPDDMERLLHAGPEAVVLASAADLFYPDVRVEVWDQEPPAPAGDWDQAEEVDFTAPSRTVSLWGPADECAGRLSVSTPKVRLRASCRGRAEAAAAVEESEADVRGVESWLLQLWPG